MSLLPTEGVGKPRKDDASLKSQLARAAADDVANFQLV